jgi:HK97 gp10 family phage protein
MPGPITLRVTGISGVVANLHNTDKLIKEDCQKAVKRAADDIVKLAKELAPKDTGRLARSIKAVISPEGLAFQVLCDPEVFKRDNVENYAWWVEAGTVNSPAQPFLKPAHEAIAPHFQADIRQAVMAALARARI